MKKFRVKEIGDYYAIKIIEAETANEARQMYLADPCEQEDYTVMFNTIKIEEIKE